MRTDDENMIDLVASLAHEANAELCVVLGDPPQPPWVDAPAWVRESARAGVLAILRGEVVTPRGSHASWCRKKREDGWVYGPVKDPAAKTHPCLVDFDELPPEQRAKDVLFMSVVSTAIAVELAVETELAVELGSRVARTDPAAR